LAAVTVTYHIASESYLNRIHRYGVHLQNVPNYTEASIQLESKAQKKTRHRGKKIEINKIKDDLKRKSATNERIDRRRETEIKFLENELLIFSKKDLEQRFVNQKSLLVKTNTRPSFTIVQDLAESRKYDFIFDKSSDFNNALLI
jgi:hypothetical protein